MISIKMSVQLLLSSDMDSYFSTVDPCSLNACLNGGTCAADSDWPYFTCNCPSGYIGFNCGTEIGNVLQRAWLV